MSVEATWRTIEADIAGIPLTLRVTPIYPEGRKARVPAEPRQKIKAGRDQTSAWSVFISYEDVNGALSERRITCRQIERAIGGTEMIGAYCHERNAPRAFRIDRIREVVDLSTGEIHEGVPYFDALRADGFPVLDRGLATFAKLLVFVSRCDGHAHETEVAEIEDALARYAMRFDCSDSCFERAVSDCKALAPDAEDFRSCLGTLLRTPEEPRRKAARLLIDACSRVIDADGHHAPEEVEWGIAIGAALKRLAV